jgi:hypothetical protein
VQKRCGWAKFPLKPLHFSTTFHAVLHSPFSLSFSISSKQFVLKWVLLIETSLN